uniref:Sulfotransferase n=1 Tax=Oncorhynchus kisutch TaxID=8019 RepID=A0A8C7GX29_ONCKI
MAGKEELSYSEAIAAAGDAFHRFPLIKIQGGYWEEREKRNILYIFYEDMKENPQREVERIMRYLDLSLADDVISRIVELTSFKTMKENPMANYSFITKPVFDQSISPFMRKGVVGDWTNHFSPAQTQLFDEDYKRKMKDADIPFRTDI